MARAIRLYWSGGRDNVANFGDSLSPVLVEVLSGRRVVFAGVHSCELLVIGSILERYANRAWRRRLALNSRPVSVWGSGTIKAGGPISLGPAHVFSVRGTRTRERLGLSAATPMGDPGLLVDVLLGDRRPGKSWRWGIVPHVNDRVDPRFARLCERTPGATFIDVGNPDVQSVARRIASCEYIASSSLHGVIAADSLGVPNIRIVAGNRIRGGNWKFDDYLTSLPARKLLTRQLDDRLCLQELESELTFGYCPDIDRLKKSALEAFARTGV